MNIGSFSKTFFPLIAIYLILAISLSSLSYKFLISNFINIEEYENKEKITTFAKFLNENLSNLYGVTQDYSTWDDTYNFIKNKNNTYIYENFREGAETLEKLDIDALIFVNEDDKIVYSNYNKRVDQLNLDKNKFQKNLVKKLKNDTEMISIISSENKLFYSAKSKISKSDLSATTKGYLIGIKFINIEHLKDITDSIFKKIEYKHIVVKSIPPKINVNLKYLKHLRAFVNINGNTITNNIEIFDYKNKYLVTFLTSDSSTIISQGKKTINIFNSIGAIILFIVFLVIYQKQRLILEQNELLNEKVEKRTKQLSRAYRSLKTKNRELYKLAHTDFLTSIRNRGNFFENSIKLLKESNYNNKSFAVIMIDIDYFKKINDTYGHSTGDKVLISFCDIVNSIIDDNMIFGRLGGEEFAISIYDFEEKVIHEISEKIRVKCSKSEIDVDGNKIKFTVSIGVSLKQNENETIDEIIHGSDELLYKAKRAGRNRVVRAL